MVSSVFALNVASAFFGVGVLLSFWLIRKPLYFVATAILILITTYSGIVAFTEDQNGLMSVFYVLSGLGSISGLLFVRVMLMRSVSLGALLLVAKASNTGKAEELSGQLILQINQEIEQRLLDIKRSQFVASDDGQLTLTSRGRRFSTVASALIYLIQK